jgi:hypothetical protein
MVLMIEDRPSQLQEKPIILASLKVTVEIWYESTKGGRLVLEKKSISWNG